MNWYSKLFLIVSWLCSLPLMHFTWRRLRKPGNYDSFSRNLPVPSQIDYFIKAVLIVYTFYYVCDSFVLAFLIYRNFDMCNSAFLFHHLVTLAGLPFALSFPHYPWFVIGPTGFHCFLVMFPYLSWLNYGYLFFMVFCMFGLQSKPWYNHSRYRGLLHAGYALIVGPLVTLWLFSCKNDMENTDVFS